MPRTINTTVYKYDELSCTAQEKARDDWRETMTTDVYDRSCEMVRDDADNIGLTIEQLGQYRADNSGYFFTSAFDTVQKIFKEHGPDCETHKIAAAYEAAIDALPDDVTNLEEQSRQAEALDALETEFLADLLEAYRKMRDKEDEYQLSDEMVAENIRANEYEYTEDGKFVTRRA